jgi:hypothetical protein
MFRQNSVDIGQVKMDKLAMDEVTALITNKRFCQAKAKANKNRESVVKNPFYCLKITKDKGKIPN